MITWLHKILIKVFAALSAAGLAAIVIHTSGAAETGDSVQYEGREVHPTRIIAKYREGFRSRADQAETGNGEYRFRTRRKLALVPGLVILDEPESKSANSPPPPARTTKEQSVRLASRIQFLRQSGQFEYVEPDHIVHATAALPTDTAFVDGTLWGLRNTGQSNGVAGADIAAPAAWNLTTGSTNIIVAVVDSGIRYTHQDLAANMWRNSGEIPGNGIDDDANGYVDDVYGFNAITGSGNPMDDNGHGTHVAGTIGATANGGGPHVGVNWNVRLMACKFLNSAGAGNTSDAVESINFAVAHGARIISASYGSLTFSQATFDAIQGARDAGVLFVAAAGNGGGDSISDNNDVTPFYPASYNLDNILSVAALDRSDNLASFSNFGLTSVDLGAPGRQIYSTYAGSDTDYRTLSGTSMATPHVSGVAALVLSRYPDMTLQELRKTLLESAVPIAALSNRCVTGGRLNAFNAVNISPRGTLNLTVTPDSSESLLAGDTIALTVNVSDRIGVTNATVSITIPGTGVIQLRNDGVAPDVTANDANYSAWVTAPLLADEFPVTVLASAPGKADISQPLSYVVVTPEVNDAFAKPILLTGSHVHVTGSNRNASKEEGEPSHGGNPGGRSVWYAWTAPSNGTATVSTSGSSFNSVVAVYTGTRLADIQLVAETADDWQRPIKSSHATFNAIAGITYRIAVDGRFNASGDVVLAVEMSPLVSPPANDLFTSRIPLQSRNDGRYLVAGAFALNLGATRENGEPAHAGLPATKSVWFTWTAPSNGVATVYTTNISFDTLLAVYTNSTLATLQTVATNDDASSVYTGSRASFQAVAGRAYQIAIDGWEGDSGYAQLNVMLQPEFAGVPPNNNFAQAIVLTGRSVATFGSNAQANKEAGEMNHAGNLGGKSVWWSWTAPATGTATVSTADSDFDTLLGVYQGTAVGSLTLVATNNNVSASNLTSLVSFPVTSGQIYRIAVDGNKGSEIFEQAATGHISLRIDLITGSAPLNDLFANRFVISGQDINTNGVNLGASFEAPSEPAHAGISGGKSIWWSWTPTQSGLATLSTEGSTFDTLLAVYTGTTLPGLTEVVSNNDSQQGGSGSRLSFSAQAGVAYQIAVDGKNGASGLAMLRVSNDTGSATIAPQIVSPPAGHSLPEGSTLLLEVTAIGAAPLLYQWFHNDVALPGATGSSLMIPGIKPPQAGAYRVVVANATAMVSSRSVVVTVTGASSPSNDMFANRSPILQEVLTVNGSNVGATVESSEPAHHNLRTRHSVWWTWTAPSAGRYSLSTIGSNFDTVLGVYTGTELSSLVKVASSDDPQSRGRGAWVVLEAASGQTFQIAVDGFNEATGSIQLSVLPAAAVQLGNTSISSSTGFRSNLIGESGIYYWIQASTNLIDWQTISNIQATGLPLEFGDPLSTNYLFRFYRMVQEP